MSHSTEPKNPVLARTRISLYKAGFEDQGFPSLEDLHALGMGDVANLVEEARYILQDAYRLLEKKLPIELKNPCLQKSESPPPPVQEATQKTPEFLSAALTSVRNLGSKAQIIFGQTTK